MNIIEYFSMYKCFNLFIILKFSFYFKIYNDQVISVLLLFVLLHIYDIILIDGQL